MKLFGSSRQHGERLLGHAVETPRGMKHGYLHPRIDVAECGSPSTHDVLANCKLNSERSEANKYRRHTTGSLPDLTSSDIKKQGLAAEALPVSEPANTTSIVGQIHNPALNEKMKAPVIATRTASVYMN